MPLPRCRLTLGRMLVFVACVAVSLACVRETPWFGLVAASILGLTAFRTFVVRDRYRGPRARPTAGGIPRLAVESFLIALMIAATALVVFGACTSLLITLAQAARPHWRGWGIAYLLGGLMASLAVAYDLFNRSLPEPPAVRTGRPPSLRPPPE